MPFEIKYNSDFYKIEVDEAKSLLKARWLRPITDSEIRIGGTKLYEVIRDTKVERAVANAQLLTALSSSTKEWMSTTFYDLLSQTQLKKLARVLPSNLFHQIGLESVITRAEAMGRVKFQTRNFASDDEAFKWAQE